MANTLYAARSTVCVTDHVVGLLCRVCEDDGQQIMRGRHVQRLYVDISPASLSLSLSLGSFFVLSHLLRLVSIISSYSIICGALSIHPLPFVLSGVSNDRSRLQRPTTDPKEPMQRSLGFPSFRCHFVGVICGIYSAN